MRFRCFERLELSIGRMVGCAWKRLSVILHEGFSSTYGLHLFTLSAELLYTLNVSRFKLRPVLRTAYHFSVSMNFIIVWIFFSSSAQPFSAPTIPELYHKSSVIGKSSKSSVLSKSYVISNSSVITTLETNYNIGFLHVLYLTFEFVFIHRHAL
jgi:hypothetical protein